MEINKEIPIPYLGLKYFIIPYHRNKSISKIKSLWAITPEDELICFERMYANGWKEEYEGWGLQYLRYNYNTTFHITGHNSRGEELYIAKFIDSSKNGIWHGYPADYQRKNQDIPKTKILNRWKKDGIISTSQFRKIQQAKKCKF